MILFLDFDGVLHPDAVYLERRRPVLRAEGSLFMWAPLLADLLADLPRVRIVLSTSWARELGFDSARRRLPEPLRARVIGATWHSAMGYHKESSHRQYPTWWDTATRYEQIKRYAERTKTSDWVAVDDQPEGWAEIDHDKLVKTDSIKGISDSRALLELDARLHKMSQIRGNSSD